MLELECATSLAAWGSETAELDVPSVCGVLAVSELPCSLCATVISLGLGANFATCLLAMYGGGGRGGGGGGGNGEGRGFAGGGGGAF